MSYFKILSEYYKKHQTLFNLTVLSTLCIIVFYNILESYFIEVDDFSSILHRKRNLLNILLTNTKGSHSGGNYRPLESLSHLIDLIVFGDSNYFGRRVINLLIHILNTSFVYLIVTEISGKKIIGLLSGLIFAVHVIHSHSLPPVSWIPGRSDLLVTFFYLVTIYLYIKAFSKGSTTIYLVSLFTFLLALLSKELAVTLPLIITAYTLLYPSYKEGKGIFSYRQRNIIFVIVLFTGILLILSAVFITPGFFLSYISKDQVLQVSTVKQINTLRMLALKAGSISITGILVVYFILKLLARKFNSITVLRYAIPFFLILGFFLIIRFLIIGEFGGAYKSSEGNVFLQTGIDTFARDMMGLASLFWPVGNDYNLIIFSLQVNYPFLFYFIAFLLVFILLFTFYRSFFSRSRLLIFSLIWLFVILIPTHNVLLPPWQTQPRYLYLPLAGFCLFLSVAFFQLYNNYFNSKTIRIGIICFFIIVIMISSLTIINYNSRLKRAAEFMHSFVKDLQPHKSIINDSTHLYFINFPSSVINSVSNIYITAYMNDVLNYLDEYDGYNKRYDYNIIFFVDGQENSNLNIQWIDRESFTIEGIDPSKYFIIPKQLSQFDIQIQRIYKRTPFHASAKYLSSLNHTELINSDIAAIKDSTLENKYKIVLKQSDTDNRLFFLYEQNRFKLINNFSPVKNLGYHYASEGK